MRPGLLLLTAALLSCVFAGAWIFWGVYGADIAGWASGEARDLSKAGQWGDSFGAFNALISSLGFCAVALTLWSQSKALDQQQKALDAQQLEIKQQQEALYRQRFETTFFELLKLVRECRDEYAYGGLKGHRAFQAAADQLSLWEANRAHFKGDLLSDYRSAVHRDTEATLSPYFRVIYRILDRLRDDKILSNEEKLSHAKLLRGQISSAELTLIGVNGKMDFAKDMATMIEQYRLLKYLPEGDIRTRLLELYSSETFKGHEPIGQL